MFYLPDFVAVAGGYLLGSVSFAILVCRALALPDPRTRGSGNPGATNVVRAGGRWAGVLTLGGDILKAAVPMLLAQAWGLTEFTVALTGFAAFIGHLYPLYHGFKGGKGVATFLGVLVVVQWQAALVAVVVWLAVLSVFRYVSVASMVAALAAPVYVWYSMPPRGWLALVLAAAFLVLIKHAGNIRNLLSHPEREGKLK